MSTHEHALVATVPITLQRLWVDRDSGRLAELCTRAGVDLLVMFGDCLRTPAAAACVDLAFVCEQPGSRESVTQFFVERYGSAVRLHRLDAMPVAERQSTVIGAALLVGWTREKFAAMLCHEDIDDSRGESVHKEISVDTDR